MTDRDTMEQERIKIEDLDAYFAEKFVFWCIIENWLFEMRVETLAMICAWFAGACCGGGFVENRESFKENKEKYDK